MIRTLSESLLISFCAAVVLVAASILVGVMR